MAIGTSIICPPVCGRGEQTGGKRDFHPFDGKRDIHPFDADIGDRTRWRIELQVLFREEDSPLREECRDVVVARLGRDQNEGSHRIRAEFLEVRSRLAE